MKEPLVIILGPTAVGKTEISIEIAKKIQGEIISADSMLIYRHMNIGTAKPNLQERQGVPHHLIDIIQPDQVFSVADFCLAAEEKIKEIRERKKMPMLVGGTALYLKAFTEKFSFPEIQSDMELREKFKLEAEKYGNNYLYEQLEKVDPVTARRLHPNDLRRVIRALEVYQLTEIPLSRQAKKEKESNYRLVTIGLIRPREELYKRINCRVEQMIKDGLVEEVKHLLQLGYTSDLVSMQGLGYKEIVTYLKGDYTLERAVEVLQRNTRHFAKRQLTWFRKEEDIYWFDLSKNEDKENVIREIVQIIETIRS